MKKIKLVAQYIILIHRAIFTTGGIFDTHLFDNRVALIGLFGSMAFLVIPVVALLFSGQFVSVFDLAIRYIIIAFPSYFLLWIIAFIIDSSLRKILTVVYLCEEAKAK